MNPNANLWRWPAVVLVMTGSLLAGDAVWNKADAGSHDWNVVENWLPNTTFPNCAGQAAWLTNDLAGAQTVRLRQNITVGILGLGDGAASGNDYGITIGNATGEDFALTFDSGSAGVSAELFLSSSGTALNYMSVPVVLQSDLLVDLKGVDSSNRQRLTFSRPVTVNGRNLVFTNGIYNTQVVSIGSQSDVIGTGSVVNNSSSTINTDVYSAFGGTLVANGKATGSNQSTFTFTNGGFTNVAELVVNGWISNSNVREGGGVHSGNGSGFTQNPGQRFPRSRITLNGGFLMAAGQASSSGTDNDWRMGLEWVADDVAVLDFSSGYCYLGMAKGNNPLGTKWNAQTIQRGRGASVYLFKVNGTDQLLFADNGASLLSGAGGVAGTTTMGIVPWASIYNGGGYTAPAGFATYEATAGFRPLDLSTEYSSSITAGEDHNVSTGNITLSGSGADATVNSLRFDGYGTCNIGAGRVLTVKSGAVFMKNNSALIGGVGDVNAGTLNFGSAEGVVSVHATQTGTIGAVIAGSGGLSKVQSGTLILTGVNTYTGPTHAGGGTLRVGNGSVAGRLGAGDVDVHAGAILKVSCVAAIPDGSTVTIRNVGPEMYFGKVDLDGGMNETVNKLYLGDEGMPAGTYGSTSSSAVNKDDRYFSGTGVLTVTASAVETKQGTVILLN